MSRPDATPRPETRRRIEFLICGSPNDAFYSQIAFFRRCLDHLGGDWEAARVVAVFGADRVRPLPARWRPHFSDIEVHHAAPEAFARDRFFAASDLRFRLLDPDADVSIISDADTALLRPLPDDVLDEMIDEPAIAAVPAHYPFPVLVDGRPTFGAEGLYPGMPPEDAWAALGRLVLGRPMETPYRHVLDGTGSIRGFRSLPGPLPTRVRTAAGLLRNYRRRSGEFIACPLYPNYGFVAGSPALLRTLAGELDELHPVVAEHVGGSFYGQVAIAVAIERASLPARALPIVYNFPNEPRADALYPDEIDRIVVLHYMNTTHFDRHRVFADAASFDEFLGLALRGSNGAFQRHVRLVTGGTYPFGP